MVARALVAGVGDFPEPYLSEEDQADGRPTFEPLPAIAQAVRVMASSLDRVGVTTGGEPLLEVDRNGFMTRWKEIRQQASPGEPLIVHFAGHGAQPDNGSLYLATAGADARDEHLDDTCVSFGQLLSTAENSGRPVLFLLDVCGAGQAILQQQLQELAANRTQDAIRNTWVIGACAGDAVTFGARFTAAAATILHDLADSTLDITPTLEYVPVETLAVAIQRELARADASEGRPNQAIVRTSHISAAQSPQPFFRNPSFAHNPGAALLDGMNPRLREFALGCSPGLDPLHFATRAAGNPTANVFQFCGRATQLKRIESWINLRTKERTQRRILVVTGSPGSGKSALLGVTACLTHSELDPMRAHVRSAVREFRPKPDGHVLAVHARQLTLDQITESLHEQLRRRRDGQLHSRGVSSDLEEDEDLEGAGPIVRAIREAGKVLLIVDALDEAANPREVLNQLLLPLAGRAFDDQTPGCRVVIGTRPWWDDLPELFQQISAYGAEEVRLDPATSEDRAELADDLHSYLDQLLDDRYPPSEVRRISDRLAQYTDSGAFLVAALYADHLLASREPISPNPPSTMGEVFALHTDALAATDPWLKPVLTVLGRAQGQGMPLELIHTAALAHQPPTPDRPTPQLTDTRRVLAKAAFYLRSTPDMDQRLLYRYFHQALTDRTEHLSSPAVIHDAFIDSIPHTDEDAIDWGNAQPYLLRHSTNHAVAAGNDAVDRLLEDLRFLVFADPDGPVLHRLHINSESAFRNAQIYRARRRGNQKPEVRRELLALDAAHRQLPDLAEGFAAVLVNQRSAAAFPLWATNGASRPGAAGGGSTGRAEALAPMGGTASAFPGASSAPGGLEGHTADVTAIVSTALPDGAIAVLTASADSTVIVRDLKTGRRLHTLTGHTKMVAALAAISLPSLTPTVVSVSWDRTAAVWDVGSGQRLHTLTGHTGAVTAVGTITLPNGRPAAVTTSRDRTAAVWDVGSGQRLHTLTGHTGAVTAVATVTLPNGRPAAVTTSADWTAIVWDLNMGQRLHTLEGHTAEVIAAVFTVLPNGTPAAVTTSWDRTAAVWDVSSGQRLHTLIGHSGPVTAVAVTALPDGTLAAVTTSWDQKAIVWDVSTGQRLHTLASHTGPVTAVVTTTMPNGMPVAITTSWDRTAAVWDLSTGQEMWYLPLPAAEQRAARTEAGFVIVYSGEIANYAWSGQKSQPAQRGSNA
ncbi:hypothetical protein [Kitasatospora sp. NPDC090091]|uniref:hypothetical protein n=1 Tax=Kitasatospora sp. NPDC090091 TaxID=3364081 RepID=UPI0037F90040